MALGEGGKEPGTAAQGGEGGGGVQPADPGTAEKQDPVGEHSSPKGKVKATLELQASELAAVPGTGEFLLLSGPDHVLLRVDADGDLVDTRLLDADVLPQPVQRIIQRCMEKAPEQRFQSARDLGFALRNSSSSTGSLPALEAPAATTSRRGVFVTALLTLALAFGRIEHSTNRSRRPSTCAPG